MARVRLELEVGTDVLLLETGDALLLEAVPRSQFQPELFIPPPPTEIYFLDIQEEIKFEEK